METGGVRYHFGWGLRGGTQLFEETGCANLVVVDVLSFSTTVSIATSRGIAIVPAPPGRAEEIASSRGARLASPTRPGSDNAPWSLSPSRMLRAPVVAEVVLASPNGGKIAALAGIAASSYAPLTVVAACLRNLSAVCSFLLDNVRQGDVAVIAAGERWAGGSLRPAIEDLAGAGALLDRLSRAGVPAASEHGPVRLSLDAELAARSVAGLTPVQLARLVRESRTAAELRARGYETDVELACEVDVARGVPVLRGSTGAFANFRASRHRQPPRPQKARRG